MTQNKIKAKLKLLASLASSAAILEREIKADIKTEKSQKVSSIVIRDVREGKNKNVDEVMNLLEELGNLSHLPKGEPVAAPFVDLIFADNIEVGVRYPEGDEFLAALGAADYGTYQMSLSYDAVNDKGDDVVVDLAFAEIKKGELAKAAGLSENNRDVDVYVHKPISVGDYGYYSNEDKFTVAHDDVTKLLEADFDKEE